MDDTVRFLTLVHSTLPDAEERIVLARKGVSAQDALNEARKHDSSLYDYKIKEVRTKAEMWEDIRKGAAEVSAMKEAIKERSRIYQVDEKTEIAQLLGMPLNSFYDLPFWEWSIIRSNMQALREKAWAHYLSDEQHPYYADLPKDGSAIVGDIHKAFFVNEYSAEQLKDAVLEGWERPKT